MMTCLKSKFFLFLLILPALFIKTFDRGASLNTALANAELPSYPLLTEEEQRLLPELLSAFQGNGFLLPKYEGFQDVSNSAKKVAMFLQDLFRHHKIHPAIRALLENHNGDPRVDSFLKHITIFITVDQDWTKYEYYIRLSRIYSSLIHRSQEIGASVNPFYDDGRTFNQALNCLFDAFDAFDPVKHPDCVNYLNRIINGNSDSQQAGLDTVPTILSKYKKHQFFEIKNFFSNLIGFYKTHGELPKVGKADHNPQWTETYHALKALLEQLGEEYKGLFNDFYTFLPDEAQSLKDADPNSLPEWIRDLAASIKVSSYYNPTPLKATKKSIGAVTSNIGFEPEELITIFTNWGELDVIDKNLLKFIRLFFKNDPNQIQGFVNDFIKYIYIQLKQNPLKPKSLQRLQRMIGNWKTSQPHPKDYNLMHNEIKFIRSCFADFIKKSEALKLTIWRSVITFTANKESDYQKLNMPTEYAFPDFLKFRLSLPNKTVGSKKVFEYLVQNNLKSFQETCNDIFPRKGRPINLQTVLEKYQTLSINDPFKAQKLFDNVIIPVIALLDRETFEKEIFNNPNFLEKYGLTQKLFSEHPYLEEFDFRLN